MATVAGLVATAAGLVATARRTTGTGRFPFRAQLRAFRPRGAPVAQRRRDNRQRRWDFRKRRWDSAKRRFPFQKRRWEFRERRRPSQKSRWTAGIGRGTAALGSRRVATARRSNLSTVEYTCRRCHARQDAGDPTPQEARRERSPRNTGRRLQRGFRPPGCGAGKRDRVRRALRRHGARPDRNGLRRRRRGHLLSRGRLT